MGHEYELSGGNASGPVVKVGDTVRKIWTAATPGVHALMVHVHERGVDVPSPLGRDDTARQIIEYVPGSLAIDASPLTHDELHRVGAMIRAIHDASEDFSPPADITWETAIAAPGADLVCHNDLAPWNLIVGDRWVFIDWDAAAPSTRLWDLAYAAQSFALSEVDASPARAAAGLRAFVDGYGADLELRRRLPSAMHRRAAAMLDMLTAAHEEHREPWASMFADGHGSHWAAVVDYVGTHRAVWLDALTR
ncbi:Ser/Thr protein kinase RdoA (MazF antagonist) [Microbacterium phyllosphaerae]|uniref:Ser/Thr protein kinase RdoA (MazF antagonist) n=1 Tax=Microbacterium phyllosphaerae TaxID=124798 RepID=A0ABS4WSM7_9MICO|nr:phosphotransferase [Microbacterium phyllosphaerae]MBP2379061.1 Ser/Thr protein kinase RdoA (MazF antagonist) [Microbacterium phyllosphaerae]